MKLPKSPRSLFWEYGKIDSTIYVEIRKVKNSQGKITTEAKDLTLPYIRTRAVVIKTVCYWYMHIK